MFGMSTADCMFCFQYVSKCCIRVHFDFKDSVLKEANAALTEENRRLRFEVQDSVVRFEYEHTDK